MTAKLVPVSDRDRELYAAPTIASQFPVTFANKNSITELDGFCTVCNKSIPQEKLHGFVTRPSEQMAEVEAVGMCPDCKLLSRFRYRLYDDMRFTGIDRQGQWASWQMKPTLGSRFKRAARWLFFINPTKKP